MAIVKTIVWVLVLVALAVFSYNNWTPIDVKIWENLVLETKLPALVTVAFLAGLLPMWLLHRASRWRSGRRISALETQARNVPPAMTSTQLEAAAPPATVAAEPASPPA